MILCCMLIIVRRVQLCIQT